MSKSKKPIRILHLEDSPIDAELIKDTLETEGLVIESVLVDNEENFSDALTSDSFDLILCDYNLPDYDGISALTLALEKSPSIPVLMISGSINEEEAIKCLQRGAADYIFKQKLKRLPSAVRRAMREAEERRLRLDAERIANRSQRLESIGNLAGGIAHDLNNALAPIVISAETLIKKYPADSELLELIQNSTKRATELVRQLLGYVKGMEGEKVLLSCGSLIDEITKLVNASFPKNIKLVVKCDSDLSSVVGDATQLQQVLLNLCVNARDAMPLGGTLTLSAEQKILDAAYASSLPDGKPGEYVMLSVQDTGNGIPQDIIDRIFEPFFTTKSSEQATGLGLSSVIGIAKGHNGFVQVSSKPGQGSTFSVYLPVSHLKVEPAVPANSSVDFSGQGETILIVDDDAAIRLVTATVLENLNFKTVSSSSGPDGLEQARAHQASLCAIITDLHMPIMDGLMFARVIRQMLPNIPVILASGNIDQATLTQFNALGMTAFLNKPFTVGQLSETLESLLPRR